jgi:hypothetical protein
MFLPQRAQSSQREYGKMLKMPDKKKFRMLCFLAFFAFIQLSLFSVTSVAKM